MKRIINGVSYNTDTATVVAWYDYVGDEGIEREATVYQTRGGGFFVVHSWEEDGRRRHSFEPTDRSLIADMIGPSALQGQQSEPEATIYLRVPASLKKRIEEHAKLEGLSVNSFALRCFERCIGRSRGTDAQQAEIDNILGCLETGIAGEREAMDAILRRLNLGVRS